MRKLLACLCVVVSLCFVACDKQETVSKEPDGTYRTAQNTTESVESTSPTTYKEAIIGTAQSTTESVESTSPTTYKEAVIGTVQKTNGTSVNTTITHEETITITQTPNVQTQSNHTVFNTENITRIILYAYYGQGTGSQVPSENMTEIINWLGSFTVGEKAPEMLEPGTNTYNVEITYSDGTVIKEGLDVIVIDGTPYYTNSSNYPDCFMDIISKTSLQ